MRATNTRWMNRKWLLIVAIVGLTTAVVLSIPSFKAKWTVGGMPLSGQIIVVDAGHGGPDPGAVSAKGVLEKDINLNIAQSLRNYLQQSGAYVVMTRESDTDLANGGTPGLRKRKVEDLHARVQIIKETEPNLVISIHLNSMPSPRWSGAQTFYHPALEQSEQLAVIIQRQLIDDLRNTTRAAKQTSDIYVLKAAHVPAVLVEAGFLSNPAEAELLNDRAYQERLAASIYRGVLSYFAKNEGEPDTPHPIRD